MSNLGHFTTRSGETVKLRLVQKEDAPLLVDLFHHLSPETKRLRFHLYTEKIPEELVWKEAILLSTLDPKRQVAVIGTIIEEDEQEHAVGVARFARATVEDTEAEVAIVIRDDFQRKGLGREMLILLAEKARELGITHFTGWVLADNVRLMKLMENLELTVESEIKHGQRKIRALISDKED